MRAQTTCSSPSFRPASTILRFSMTRTVWPSMSGGSGLASSSGQVGIWPVTKHQPSTSTAWLNGATGVGAPGAMKNSGGLIVPASIVIREEQDTCQASRLVRRAPRPHRGPAHTALAADLQQLLALGGIDTAVAAAPVGILPDER